MSAEPRVLVTGAGGPSGDLDPARDRAASPSTHARGRHRPVRRGPVPASARTGAHPAARRRPALRRRCCSTLLPSRAGRRARPDRRQRAAPARAARASSFAAAGVDARRRAARRRCAVCLDKWRLAERCRGRVRVPATRGRRRRLRSRRRRAAGHRQAAVGERLARHPAARAARGARGARRATARCWCRSTCPGPEYSLDVLARADGHVAGVVPRERLKVDSGIAVTGRTLHDERSTTFGRTRRRADRPDDRRQRAGQGRDRRRAGAARGQPALPGHDAAHRRQRRRHAARWRSARRSASRCRTGRSPFEDIAMVRYFEERFFAFDEIADAAARRRDRIAS